MTTTTVVPGARLGLEMARQRPCNHPIRWSYENASLTAARPGSLRHAHEMATIARIGTFTPRTSAVRLRTARHGLIESPPGPFCGACASPTCHQRPSVDQCGASVFNLMTPYDVPTPCSVVFAFTSSSNLTDTSVPSFFLTFIVSFQVMFMSIALPSIWRLSNAGALVLFGGTARPNPSIISFAPFLLFSSSPWSHSISTSAFSVASEALALPNPISQLQWKRYARLSLRRVLPMSTA